MDRNIYIDYAKAIGIVLVVLGHVVRGVFNAGIWNDEPLFTLVDSVIYSFHMPLFFFLAGLFFYDSFAKRGPAGIIINKIDSILYPFIIWSIIQGTVEVFLSSYTNGNVTFSEVFSFAWRPRAQFWFLYALFLIFFVFTIIYKLFPKIPALLLTLSCVGLYIASAYSPILHASYICDNAVFFSLGILFSKIPARSYQYLRNHFLIFSSFFFLSQYLFHGQLHLSYESRDLFSLALAVISILFIMSLSCRLSSLRIEWFGYIGACSMTIYLLHILAGSGARVIMQRLMDISDPLIHVTAGTAIGLIAPLVAHFAIKRFNLSFFLVPPYPISATHIFGKRGTDRIDLKQST